MKAHHVELDEQHLEGNGGLGRYVLLPGSPDRAARIATRLTDVQVVDNRRKLTVHLGRFGDLDVAAVPTGMGCPSVDIVATELIHIGARRLLRVGTAGALQPEVRLGDLVVASGAVRDEGTSDAYVPRDYPAVADVEMAAALCRAADHAGLSERVHCGIVHSKDSFFGREFAQGPDAERNRAYMEQLSAAGVLATEMEAAHLFVLGMVHGRGPRSVAASRTRATKLRTGAICAVVGSVEEGFVSLSEEQAAEERLIDVALAGLVELAKLELR